MKNKPNTSPRTKQGVTPKAQDSLEALAAHISAVLNHPRVPHRIYTALSDELSDITGGALNEITDGAPFITRGLELFYERRAPEGGAR